MSLILIRQSVNDLGMKCRNLFENEAQCKLVKMKLNVNILENQATSIFKISLVYTYIISADYCVFWTIMVLTE